MLKCLRGESDTIIIRFNERREAQVKTFLERDVSDWVKAA